MTDIDSEIHLMAIRDALVKGNAAVMIGAGFSRNAEGGEQLSTWEQIAEELWAQLNPDNPTGKFSSQLVTQLGEQYTRVFSISALENLLKKMVPDERVAPGDLHSQLLTMGWSEIFTTNYDTLIERAAEDIVDRAHYTVTCREDIPHSKILNRRRIVKLHGSFPSQRPFIFTEEDYRTYPEKFAPFVNLVRQSMLENVFCLIGFSGDDPNFLNWIGWVRDMLDMHALPVYLFVGEAPSIGQRKLLEARRVTPLILPKHSDPEKNSYKDRYKLLFDKLLTPIEPENNTWGTIESFLESDAPYLDGMAQFNNLLLVLPSLFNLQTTYPGWLVAPLKVRKQLEQSIKVLPMSFDSIALRNKLETDSPILGIIAFSQYSWLQDVLLKCIDDSIAIFSLRLIRNFTVLENSQSIQKERSVLNSINIFTVSDVKSSCQQLLLGLLRWAREGLRHESFNEVKEIIERNFYSVPIMLDSLKLESILFTLYEGNRASAKQQLLEWEVRSVDAFMQIRRGALLAELNEIDVGLKFAKEGLQSIRLKQKQRSGDSKLLSEESWACLIISRMEKARQFNWGYPASNQDDQFSDKLSSRLLDLAARGFDPQREQDELLNELNAESPLPSESQCRSPTFELGGHETFHILGLPYELEKKMDSALAWLTLIDRAALVPRMANMSFNINYYTQAAWWAQYRDSMQRVLGVLIRTLDNNLLKAKDVSKKAHMTNWLSRYQVAKIEEESAHKICRSVMDSLEVELLGKNAEREIYRSIQFYITIFSRLIIRIIDSETILSYVGRIANLLKSKVVWENPQVWKYFEEAIDHCYEALGPEFREKMIEIVVTIPVKIPTPPHTNNAIWIIFSSLKTRQNDSLLSSRIITEHISYLVNELESEDNSTWQRSCIWYRLIWLNDMQLLAQKTRLRVSEILWASKDQWPLIPSHYDWVTSKWPYPKDIKGAQLYRKFLLEKMRENSPAIDYFALRGWIESLREKSWPISDLKIGLSFIRKWWEGDSNNILQSLRNLSKGSLFSQSPLSNFQLFDEFFQVAFPNGLNNRKIGRELINWIDRFVGECNQAGAPFWKTRLVFVLANKGYNEKLVLEKELSLHLLDSNSSNYIYAENAARASLFWISHNDAVDPPKILIQTITGIVAARKMPILGWALHLMINICNYKKSWVDLDTLIFLETGLQKMLSELSYDIPLFGSGIPDEEIPLLRLNCTRLSLAILQAFPEKENSTFSKWVDIAKIDPLPEMRHVQYIYDESK